MPDLDQKITDAIRATMLARLEQTLRRYLLDDRPPRGTECVRISIDGTAAFDPGKSSIDFEVENDSSDFEDDEAKSEVFAKVIPIDYDFDECPKCRQILATVPRSDRVQITYRYKKDKRLLRQVPDDDGKKSDVFAESDSRISFKVEFTSTIEYKRCATGGEPEETGIIELIEED